MKKREILPIQCGPVRIRLLVQNDLPLTLAWRNQDAIRRWFFHSQPISPEQHQAWFEKYRERDDDFVFLIEEVEAGCHPVGQIALYHIDWEAGRAEYGRVMIGEPDASGKGLAFFATQAIFEIGFETFGLQEIYLEVYANNERAIHLYRKAGFTVTRRDRDVLIMTIHKQAWIESKDEQTFLNED